MVETIDLHKDYRIGKVLFPALVSKTLLVFFFIFAFVYTPLISFVNARLDGLVGQNVNVPYIKEATIFLSGFKGIDIWFVPFPLHNYGAAAERFRQIELTGTRFTSILKAELFMVPLVFITSFMYWSYIWKLAPIPSESYPYVQLMWPLRALQRCVWITSTMRGELEVKEKHKYDERNRIPRRINRNNRCKGDLKREISCCDGSI